MIRLMKSRRIIWAGLVAHMEERFILGFGGELSGKEPGVGGRTILRRIFRSGFGGSMDWIDLTQNRDRWQALVYAVRNFRVP